MRSITKKALVLQFAAMAFVASGAATAQSYPNKPVKIVVGFGAGGVTDVLNRIMADQMSKLSGGSFIVENRPGASGLVAAQLVKNAVPDGYTLFGGSVATYTPVFMKESLSADKDLSPISSFARGDWFMYAPTSNSITNAKELGAYAKANEGRFRFAAPSHANTMLMAMISKQLGIKFENIPYKTTDQTIQALLTGDGQVTINAASGFGPHIQSGKLRAVMTLSPTRSPLMPDVPTAKEQGLNVVTTFNIGLWAPLTTPRDLITKLHGLVVESLKDAGTATKIRNASLSPVSATPEEMLADFKSDNAFYVEGAALTGYVAQ
jgi:tripartite-type tricarboxylate transporter receptor subunit TctC